MQAGSSNGQSEPRVTGLVEWATTTRTASSRRVSFTSSAWGTCQSAARLYECAADVLCSVVGWSSRSSPCPNAKPRRRG